LSKILSPPPSLPPSLEGKPRPKKLTISMPAIALTLSL
jgi:hypothetical protein